MCITLSLDGFITTRNHGPGNALGDGGQVLHDWVSDDRGETTCTFIADGMESTLAQARAAAGDKNVAVMGAKISQQYLKPGLVDELNLRVANLQLGEACSLCAKIGTEPIELQRTRAIATPKVTPLTYRVLK